MANWTSVITGFVYLPFMTTSYSARVLAKKPMSIYKMCTESLQNMISISEKHHKASQIWIKKLFKEI